MCRLSVALTLDTCKVDLTSRRLWCKERKSDWWQRISTGMVEHSWWTDNLRMSHSTFQYICRELAPYIDKQSTVMREPIELEKRVAVTLWRLATNIEYRSLAELFGIGRPTVGRIVLETCKAIAGNLLPRHVNFPSGRELVEVIRGFGAKSGFPQIAGAIDGTHIPIIRPREHATDYFNRKGYHSVVMQAVVDFRGLFTDVYIGWPGRVHDARIFGNSDLYKKAENGDLFPQNTTQMNGQNLPIVLVGDPAYPLMTWLMKPYPEHAAMPRKQRNFNYRLSKARIAVEHAFGRLKGRWRCLLKRLDHNIENIPHVIGACVVLHNICEGLGDRWQDERFDRDDSQPSQSQGEDDSEETSQEESTSSHAPQQGRDVREAFANYLSTL